LCEKVSTERALRAAHSQFANVMMPSRTEYVTSIDKLPLGSTGSFVGSPIETWFPAETVRWDIKLLTPTWITGFGAKNISPAQSVRCRTGRSSAEPSIIVSVPGTAKSSGVAALTGSGTPSPLLSTRFSDPTSDMPGGKRNAPRLRRTTSLPLVVDNKYVPGARCTVTPRFAELLTAAYSSLTVLTSITRPCKFTTWALAADPIKRHRHAAPEIPLRLNNNAFIRSPRHSGNSPRRCLMT
jgi:hypothetical protein